MVENFLDNPVYDSVIEFLKKKSSSSISIGMEKETFTGGLTENEIRFIQQRDSFYMASIGTKGFPYIQHRGGPKGFLKILDSKQLGFIDFSGNQQYVSLGNFKTNNNVTLIIVDYPSMVSLKIYAKVEIVGLVEDDFLYSKLHLNAYKFRPERMMVFNVVAYS